MSSDEISEYENDSLIKGKVVDGEHKSDDQSGLSKCIYQCIVITLLSIILFVILASFGWFYLSVYVPHTPLLSTTTSIGSLSRLVDFGIALSNLPNNTIQVLYDHQDGMEVSEEEQQTLSEIFALFDVDGDGYWSLDEFKLFIDTAIEPEMNFHRMDLDENGVLTMKEIYFFTEAFDSTDIYECDETDNILYDIFDYTPNEHGSNKALYYEYIGQLWLYQLDTEKIGVISKVDYIEYILVKEWEYLNLDSDDFIDFTEFKDKFFDSIYYQSSYKTRKTFVNHTFLVIYQEIDAIDATTISALQLSTTPHEYDTSIDEYVRNNVNNNEYGPSKSLLYSLPHYYHFQDVVVPTARRRLVLYNEGYCEEDSCEGTEECVEVRRNSVYYGWYCYESSDQCFDDEGMVSILIDNGLQHKMLKDIAVGDYVFDGDEYSKVIAVERNEMRKSQMIKIYMNQTDITLTADHLLYDGKDELIRAGDLKVGDKIYNEYIINNIEYNVYKTPITPFTMSGMIQVNDIKASCYIAEFANVADPILAPFRFVSQYINEYYPAIIIEHTLRDVDEIYHLSQSSFNQYDVLSLFNIHPVIDSIIIFSVCSVIYGKYIIIHIISFFI